MQTEASKGDYEACQDTLVEIKLHLTNLPALPPRFEASATALEELALARECLEQAALISVQVQDEQAFERHFLQLNSYYVDTKDMNPPLPESEQVSASALAARPADRTMDRKRVKRARAREKNTLMYLSLLPSRGTIQVTDSLFFFE